MKTINLTLYTFDDLSEEVQKQIIERERWNVMGQCMDSYGQEYRNTIVEFEKIFDIKVKQWEVDYCGYNYQIKLTKDLAFEWGTEEIEFETLSGRLLMRYLQNSILPYIEKGKYYSKLVGIHPDCKLFKRYSKVIKEIECPLTGYCYDMYFLDPLLKFMQNPNYNTTYKSLMKECVESFFSKWHKEYKYWADDESAIREELHNNQYEDRVYHKDGSVYDGPQEDVA